MKHILLSIPSLALALGLWCCEGDKGDGRPAGEPENMSFRPVSGGAVMHYTLPADPDVVGINVRYRNAFDEDVIRTGSSACDSVVLVGFSEAQSSVPARVSLSYRDGRESEPVATTFATKDSGPVAFMKTVGCHPNWEGFSLSYEVPAGAQGIAHVFYLGVDPVNNRPDTLLVDSFFLEETREPGFASYKIRQDIVAPTVVVRTEDFLGYMVGEKSWEGVDNLAMEKMGAGAFDFYCDNSKEDATYRFGVEYLFDGDTKGVSCFEDNKFHTFLAGPDAAGEQAHPMYIDMKENRMVASVRLYSLFKINAGLSWYDQGVSALAITYNEDEIPCKATIYGLKDDGASPASYGEMHGLEGWTRIGSFEQDRGTPIAGRWSKHPWHMSDWTMGLTLDALQQAEAEFMDIMVPVFGQGDGWRYLRIVIDDVFALSNSSSWYINTGQYVTFHELEVYTNKE